MAGFKTPDFTERAALAADAKAKALEKLRNKPPVDEAVVAERLAAQERKDAAAAEKRRLKAEGMTADSYPDYAQMRGARMQALRLVDLPRLAAHQRLARAEGDSGAGDEVLEDAGVEASADTPGDT